MIPIIIFFVTSFVRINCENFIPESFVVKNLDFRVAQFHRHHTIKFYGDKNGTSYVIIRRGADFEFSVELNRAAQREKIRVELSFETHSDHFKVDLAEEEQNGWTMKQMVNGSQIDASIHIPGDAPVGEWKMIVYLIDNDGEEIEEIDSPNTIIVLFNPWSREDDAYFPEEEKLNEYLMNEIGTMYSFNYLFWRSNPWIFGQFQEGVLDAILMALSHSKLKATERGNIVLVSRALTHLMNYGGTYFDRRTGRVVRDHGVLIGRWKEPYTLDDDTPATKPWEWTGSAPIFKQYLESGGKPVSFGQCFVFGGILTTAYRALGIASRPVSNFLSAHSDKRDLTIDVYLNETGHVVKRELIWNFHVWVQGWMSRKDLGEDFSGWQELDATPQERNDKLYQVGPASTAAIDSGLLLKPYETAFVYEEVNADEVIWSAKKEIVGVNRASTGLAVFTKKYQEDKPEDITLMYKPPENTKDERDSYRSAAKSLNITPPSLNYSIAGRSKKKRIFIDILTQNQTFVGSSVIFDVNIRTATLRAKHITVYMRAITMYYNGQDADVLKSDSYKISPNGKHIKFIIKPEEYFGKLHDQNTIRLEAFVRYGEEISFENKHVSLENPVLKISGPKSVNVTQKFSITLEFKNPYKYSLSNCHVVIEGIRLERRISRIKDIAPSQIEKATFQLQSFYAQKEEIIVSFFASKGIKMRAVLQLSVNGKKEYQFNSFVLNPLTQVTSNIPNNRFEYALPRIIGGITRSKRMRKVIRRSQFQRQIIKVQ